MFTKTSRGFLYGLVALALAGALADPTPVVQRDGIFQPALQYDKIDSSAVTSEVETLVAAFSYFPLDNLRVAVYFQSDLVGDADKAFINLRMMF